MMVVVSGAAVVVSAPADAVVSADGELPPQAARDASMAVRRKSASVLRCFMAVSFL
ncbi:MAG: hypothetical protein J6C52_10125 [Clostridia bacterium]|nr:hypothetical protein [Clostridia bacterium]